MPNWCENEIKFDSVEDREKFEKAFVRDLISPQGNISKIIDLNLISKLPDGISNDEQYKFTADNWGTKWHPDVLLIEDNFISFESAWSPPDKAMLKASEILRIRIKILYSEVGEAYCGRDVYNNGKIEESIYLEEICKRWQIDAIENRELREFAKYVWCFEDEEDIDE